MTFTVTSVCEASYSQQEGIIGHLCIVSSNFSSSRLVTDAGGVGEYLESFSLMCVSVQYICTIYAMKKMALHKFMAARFPNFSTLNNVHGKPDI
jgi:hypothetical protein